MLFLKHRSNLGRPCNLFVRDSYNERLIFKFLRHEGVCLLCHYRPHSEQLRLLEQNVSLKYRATFSETVVTKSVPVTRLT